jgi:hypothetical protein
MEIKHHHPALPRDSVSQLLVELLVSEYVNEVNKRANIKGQVMWLRHLMEMGVLPSEIWVMPVGLTARLAVA